MFCYTLTKATYKYFPLIFTKYLFTLFQRFSFGQLSPNVYVWFHTVAYIFTYLIPLSAACFFFMFHFNFYRIFITFTYKRSYAANTSTIAPSGPTVNVNGLTKRNGVMTKIFSIHICLLVNGHTVPNERTQIHSSRFVCCVYTLWQHVCTHFSLTSNLFRIKT